MGPPLYAEVLQMLGLARRVLAGRGHRAGARRAAAAALVATGAGQALEFVAAREAEKDEGGGQPRARPAVEWMCRHTRLRSRGAPAPAGARRSQGTIRAARPRHQPGRRSARAPDAWPPPDDLETPARPSPRRL